MKQVSSPKKLNKILVELRNKGKTIGFVPTMGALHAGHLSLVRKSKKENDVTVVSIFVNKLQFGPKEDFKKYPRPLKKDLALLRKERVDFVFTPEHEDFYPGEYSLMMDAMFDSESAKPGSIADMSNRLCGKFRPGHFKGVLTVVAKLFNVVRPDTAYFGAKDYQQVRVIEQMNEDLNLFIRISIEPTVREPDGLAMSSRNQYLSGQDRKRALGISKTLFWVRDEIRRGEPDISGIVKEAKHRLSKWVDQIQYFELVDSRTLCPVLKPQKGLVALTACYVGKTRLIDNVIIPAGRR